MKRRRRRKRKATSDEVMAKRDILELGSDEGILHKHTREVTKFDDRLAQLLDDMAETMYAAEGAGLAAPQVGLLKRCCVVDVGQGLLELVNPQIIEKSGERTVVEGCLSVPGRSGRVVRPEKIKVRAQNRSGEWFETEAEGLECMAICHETDHLNGVVYTDIMIEDTTNKFQTK